MESRPLMTKFASSRASRKAKVSLIANTFRPATYQSLLDAILSSSAEPNVIF